MNKLTNRLPDALVGRLKQLFPPQYLYLDPEECWVYGYDNSGRQALPDAVVFPTTHQQVLELVGLCNQYTVALTVRGRGTGTTGATVPIQGGIVASMERMVKVIEFSPDNRYLLVEPGITNQAVQDVAAEAGFFWPPDPTSSAFCTIGGNLAYNSAGPRAVKYGTPRENTLGLRAVTGAGREIRVGVRTSKGVVGYDFTRLLIGSEGTLAIITEATLKMTPIPESKCTLRALYRSVAAAADAVSKIMSQPVIPCALELMDHQAIKMIRGYVATDLPEDVGALLMIEVDGPKAGHGRCRQADERNREYRRYYRGFYRKNRRPSCSVMAKQESAIACFTKSRSPQNKRRRGSTGYGDSSVDPRLGGLIEKIPIGYRKLRPCGKR